jgi:beta-lactamase regulating signal transducer with metallopeptidase domain
MPISDHPILAWLWQTTWQTAVVVALVVLLRATFGRVLTRRWRHALWSLVLVRLMLPVLPHSAVSIFALAHGPEATSAAPVFTVAGQFDSTPTAVIHYGAIMADSRAPKAVARPTHEIDYTTPLLIAWLVGMSLLAIRLIAGNITFARRLNRSSITPIDDRLHNLLDECCRQMRLRRTPALLITDAVAAPAVAGLIHPRLLLPPTVAADLPIDQLRLVLLHELGHIRCHDIAIDWLWAAVNCAHWFNPVVWLIRPPRHADREQARDEMVLTLTGPAAAEPYGQTILRLVQSVRPVKLCPGLVGMLPHKRALARRIETIAQFRRRSPIARVTGVLILVAAGCAALTSPSPSAQPEPAHPPVIAGSAGPSTAPSGIHDDSVASSGDSHDAAIKAALDRRIPELHFDAVPFDRVIDDLQDRMNVDIFVEWPALERADIARNAPVTARLRDIKFSKALELVFKAVEGEEDDRHLAYKINEGVITVTTRREANKNVVTRRYDVNDLLFVAPDYSNWPGELPSIGRHEDRDQADEHRPRDAEKAEPDQLRVRAEGEREARLDEIKKFIVNSVDSTSWRDNGGDVGSISTAPSRPILLITQTPENHRAIQSLLDAMRESQSVQISVETRMFILDDAAMAQLPADLRQRMTAAAQAGGNHATDSFSDAELDQLRRVVETSQASSSLTGPRLTLFSGQRATIVMANSTAYVAGFSTAVKRTGDQTTTTYDPDIRALEFGFKLNVAATASEDRKTARIDFHPVVSQLDRLDPEPWPGAPADTHLVIQKPIMSTFELRADCTIPDGASLVLGGFTESTPHAAVTPATQPAAGADATNSALFANMITAARNGHLFMLVKPTILWHGRQASPTK